MPAFPNKQRIQSYEEDGRNLGLDLPPEEQLEAGVMSNEEYESHLGANDDPMSARSNDYESMDYDMEMGLEAPAYTPDPKDVMPEEHEVQEYLKDFLIRKQQSRRELSLQFQDMHRQMSQQVFHGEGPKDL